MFEYIVQDKYCNVYMCWIVRMHSVKNYTRHWSQLIAEEEIEATGVKYFASVLTGEQQA